MSGDARQAVEDLEAQNLFDSDHTQTSLHHGNPDAEIHSENDDGPMSPLGQPPELRNGNEPQGCRSPPCDFSSDDGRSGPWISKSEWTYYIREEDPGLPNRLQSYVSIFRVPKFLKDTKSEAYVPQIVSLGPYHHLSEELRAMDYHKGRALRRIMKRFNARNDMDFANCALEEILKMENQIINIYEENMYFPRKALARMLCLDGCFLLEVLRTLGGDKLFRADLVNCYDPIFKIAYAAEDVFNDILMLENQIPFIVLLKLLRLELNSELTSAFEDLLMKVILDWFSPFHNQKFDIKQWSSLRFHHLLGFLHTVIASPPFNEGERVGEGECSIPTVIASPPFNEGESVDEGIPIDFCSRMLQRKSKGRNDTDGIPHAVELRNAGIKFSALQGGCINQIKFDENSATIFLPPISIMDRTEGVFRNLIAYEMCKLFEINYVISYAALMKDLINTEQDVALMRRMGVLKHSLGSDKEVADLFKGLCEKVTGSRKDVFDNLTEKVIAHYNNNQMKIQIGILVQDHFSSPWKALALMAAIVILLLTVLQTIFTIISTYKK